MATTHGNAIASAVKHDSRLRRVLHGGASALLNRGVMLLVSLVSLPLTTRYLGPERYGVWVTVSTTVSVLAVLDLGIANSLTNRISHAYAASDDRLAQSYFATALWLSVAIAVLLGGVGWLIWPHLDVGRLISLTNPVLIRETRICFAIAFVFFLLGLPLNLSHRVLSGYQQTQLTNYFLMLSNVLGLLAIVLAIRFQAGLVGLLLTYSATLIAGNLLLNLWLTVFHRRTIFPWPRAFRRKMARELLNGGSGFFLLQIAGLVVFNSDNLVIAHYVGAADVMPYSITWKLAGLAAVLQTAIFPSLWPAYSEAYASGNLDWVRKTFRLAVRSAMGVSGAAMLGMLLLGRTVIRWYIGPAAVPGWPLLIAICSWTLLSTLMDLEACLLAALDTVKLQAALSLVAAAVNLALSIYLVQRIGPLGVVLGTLVSYLVVLVGPQTMTVWRLLHPAQTPQHLEEHAG